LLKNNDTYLAVHYLRSDEESKESPLFLFSALTTSAKPLIVKRKVKEPSTIVLKWHVLRGKSTGGKIV